MADQHYPPMPGSPEPGRAEPAKTQQPGNPSAVPPHFPPGWPSPPPPDVFREFSAAPTWSPPVPPVQAPVRYPAPPAVGQAPAGWRVPPQAPPWPQYGSPPGLPPGQRPPTPPKISPALLALFGGLAVLIILIPIILLLSSRSSSVTVQPTPVVQRSPTVAPAPTALPSFFKPAGTAPTVKDCQDRGSPVCYSPEQIQRAFNLESLYQQGIDGTGQTIVIIGAGNTPTLEQDLHQFDMAWGLPDPPSFKILFPFGPPVPYTCGGNEDGLQLENTLDVEWSHAMAPKASIVVVIGANNERKITPPPHENKCGLDYLEDDVNYALDNHLGTIITISYGGSELGATDETTEQKANDQKEFTTAHAIFQKAAQMGVTLLASSGDDGATNGDNTQDPGLLWDKPNVSWPASDPSVLAVGGTTLQVKDTGGTYGSETVWNIGGAASGGGQSVLYPEPDYQKTVPNQSIFNGMRGLPDIAFPADINYSLYLSASAGDVNPIKWPHWTIIGGTSASSPCMAGILALASQMRGKPLGDIHNALYSLQGQGLHDITNGDNSLSGVKGYQALQGYDLVTGWGTPIADQFVANLVQALG